MLRLCRDSGATTVHGGYAATSRAPHPPRASSSSRSAPTTVHAPPDYSAPINAKMHKCFFLASSPITSSAPKPLPFQGTLLYVSPRASGQRPVRLALARPERDENCYRLGKQRSYLVSKSLPTLIRNSFSGYWSKRQIGLASCAFVQLVCAVLSIASAGRADSPRADCADAHRMDQPA